MNASEVGLGIVLSQTFNGEEYPMLYIQQKLTPTKQWYAAMEREVLSIKWAITNHRYYLTGRQFGGWQKQKNLNA